MAQKRQGMAPEGQSLALIIGDDVIVFVRDR